MAMGVNDSFGDITSSKEPDGNGLCYNKRVSLSRSVGSRRGQLPICLLIGYFLARGHAGQGRAVSSGR